MTGGGSGGHITPLLSLAQELRKLSPESRIIYIGHKGDKFDTFEESAHDFDFTAFINAGKFRRYQGLRFANGIFRPSILALNIRDAIRLPGSIAASIRILRKFQPDVVFSKGGYVALPVGIAARVLRIPIVTHDSDIVPGLANRIIGRWAKMHATGMPVDNYRYPKSSTRYVGIPIDSRIKKVTPKLQNEIKSKLKFSPDSTILMVAGGSSGSYQLNELVVTIAPELLKTNLSLNIIHLTGTAHEESVKERYNQLPQHELSRVRVMGYANDFFVLSAAADLIITRAGATTIAELAAAGKACIVVPSVYLTGGHQVKNAEALERIDAATVTPENVQPDELLALINGLLSNDSRRFELARNLYATAKVNASRDLAELILKTIAVR